LPSSKFTTIGLPSELYTQAEKYTHVQVVDSNAKFVAEFTKSEKQGRPNKALFDVLHESSNLDEKTRYFSRLLDQTDEDLIAAKLKGHLIGSNLGEKLILEITSSDPQNPYRMEVMVLVDHKKITCVNLVQDLPIEMRFPTEFAVQDFLHHAFSEMDWGELEIEVFHILPPTVANAISKLESFNENYVMLNNQFTSSKKSSHFTGYVFTHRESGRKLELFQETHPMLFGYQMELVEINEASFLPSYVGSATNAADFPEIQLDEINVKKVKKLVPSDVFKNRQSRRLFYEAALSR